MKIPRPVWLLGLVSFFNDLSAEMIYPIVPIFLTSVLHTPVQVVGIIEGLAEATASLGKFGFGAYSDYLKKRKVFVILGYTFAAISKILIAAATTWPLVLFARFIDRTGKGLRTAPRDSILLENTTTQDKGYIFGFHRAFDSLGAVFGPLLGLLFLYLLKENMRLTFLIAFIPSVIAVFLLFLVKEKKTATLKEEKKHFVKLSWKNLDYPLKIFLISSFIFALGNSADAFLILRAKSLGLTTTLAVLTYVLYNISQTIFATPAGKLADKIGAQKVFTLGLLIFAFVYFYFGFIHNPILVWVLFPIYGVYIAFTDGVSKAYISEFIKKEESGTYFGAYYTLTAVGNFLASFLGGVLWQLFHPSATMYYGAIMAIIAFLIMQSSAIVKKTY
jgi:MFS family permease